jgi:hypothetical protein
MPVCQSGQPQATKRSQTLLQIKRNVIKFRVNKKRVTKTKNYSRTGARRRIAGDSARSRVALLCLSLAILLCGVPLRAQQSPAPQLDQQAAGTISGAIVDPSGAAIAKARVKLTRGDKSPSQEVQADDDGQFSFAVVAPGPFQLTVTATGFTTKAFEGTLHPGEINVVPPIALSLSAETTEVQVVAPRAEVAEAEIKVEETQRVLGVIPNFYVSYIPNAAALNTKQKFELAWRTTIDPVTFVLTGAIAGIQQAQNNFSGYGQGAQGYGKRYGASYADLAVGTFIGSAIFPSILKQDPRYFYKGTGSIRARALYAIANALICKGDNKRWQPNYSNVLGSFAAGGISNLYYPAQNRGAALVFENAGIGIGSTAAANVLQEFLIRKLTPSAPNRNPSKP